MAKSARGSDPAFAAFSQDTVLCELNAEFKQSKRELIDRFLQDQEELNRRFDEYALDDEDGCAPNRGGYAPLVGGMALHPACYPDPQADNLSTTSLACSSTDSVPDVIDLEVEENMLSCYQEPPDEPNTTKWTGKLPQCKNKKTLVKKNIRPKTSMAVRSARPEPATEASCGLSPLVSNPPRWSVMESTPRSRSKQSIGSQAASWAIAPATHSNAYNSLGRSLMARSQAGSRAGGGTVGSIQEVESGWLAPGRHPVDSPRYTAPGRNPVESSRTTDVRDTREGAHQQKSTPAKNTEPYYTHMSSKGHHAVFLHNPRQSSDRGRLSMTLDSATKGPSVRRPSGTSRGIQISQPASRRLGDMYTTEASMSSVHVYHNSLKGKAGKRQIAVLKLPPLEAGVVGKSLPEPRTLLATPAKGTTIQSAAEFLAS